MKKYALIIVFLITHIYSNTPPGNLDIENVPQFVVIGFDDNSKANDASNGGGNQAMEWILNYMKERRNPSLSTPNSNTFDGTPASASFYSNTNGFQHWDQEDPNLLKAIHKRAYDEGHEIGNHTHSHGTTETLGGSPEVVMNWSEATWEEEVATCTELLVSAGIPQAAITGFRNPFLAYSNNTFTTIKAAGLLYDCSIEDGWQPEMDGTNYTWPYSLENGSAGSDFTDDWGGHTHVEPITGLWELPNTPVIVPPDEECSNYSVPSGLRKSIYERVYKKTEMELGGPYEWDTIQAKITGFDYNMWIKFQLTGPEVEAILKHTLDLRLKGNRAPFMFGAHTQYYCKSYYLANAWQLNTTLEEMKSAIEGFIDYALSKPKVRMTTAHNIVEWCKNPVGFNNQQVSTEVKIENKNSEATFHYGNKTMQISVPNGAIQAITLCDIQGRVFQITYDNTGFSLPGELVSGVYFLQIHSEMNTITKKIVIQ